jgi:hypothetical protein
VVLNYVECASIQRSGISIETIGKLAFLGYRQSNLLVAHDLWISIGHVGSSIRPEPACWLPLTFYANTDINMILERSPSLKGQAVCRRHMGKKLDPWVNWFVDLSRG